MPVSPTHFQPGGCAANADDAELRVAAASRAADRARMVAFDAEAYAAASPNDKSLYAAWVAADERAIKLDDKARALRNARNTALGAKRIAEARATAEEAAA